jgi:hypothetical protein
LPTIARHAEADGHRRLRRQQGSASCGGQRHSRFATR